jgi:3',5'-cyclic AMP phosphodiesterase CpdA
MGETVRYLLRFRDHGTYPISEHLRIIAEHKECWWGWWKRPYESPNFEFWKDIKEIINREKSIIIGLVDLDEQSGDENRVFFARAVQAIPPNSSIDDDYPGVPEADRCDKVAQYYSSHAPSYAWLKFTEITGPHPFFGKYSYASPPAWINVEKNSLGWLKGKVINNARELAGMNVSMWAVRSRQSADSEKELVVVFPNLWSPLSAKVIQCERDTILHITDPHFSNGPFRNKHVWRLESEDPTKLPPGIIPTSLADAILNSLHEVKAQIGLVIVTGDLTFRAHPSEFDEAIRSLRRILGTLQLGEDHLVVIPGNHDIKWTENRPMKGFKDLVVRSAGPTANAAYKQFYENILRHPPNDHLSMGRRYAFPIGTVVEICALNSSSLATGKNFLPGMGLINEQAFQEARNILGWRDRNSSALRILAVHHHLAVTENYEDKRDYLRGYGLAVNAVRIQRQAAQVGVQLALHGHKHRAFVWRSTIYELPEEKTETPEPADLAILGGGSAGSIETEGASTYYNLVKVESTKLSAAIYTAKGAGNFRRMTTFEAAFQILHGRLILDPWRQMR